MLDFIVVGIGGFIGSCFRFALTKIFSYSQFLFPFGTLFSNVIAGLLIGFIIGLENQSILILPKTKLFLTTGLLGGLSTFSTFSLETVNLFRDNKPFLASGSIFLNLILSLLGVVIGLIIAKFVVKRA
ncbi:MAG: fluoride efflux transporter CrcB [Eubacteriaceae bacterium]